MVKIHPNTYNIDTAHVKKFRAAVHAPLSVGAGRPYIFMVCLIVSNFVALHSMVFIRENVQKLKVLDCPLHSKVNPKIHQLVLISDCVKFSSSSHNG